MICILGIATIANSDYFLMQYHGLNIETNFDIFKTKLKETYELSAKIAKGDAYTKPLLEIQSLTFKFELALEAIGEKNQSLFKLHIFC